MTNRQRKLQKQLAVASNPALSFEARFTAIDLLLGIRGGLGRPARRKVATALDAIEAEIETRLAAKEINGDAHREAILRIDELRNRVEQAREKRAERNEEHAQEKHKHDDAARKLRLNNPVTPFKIPPDFSKALRWRFRLEKDGRLRWQIAGEVLTDMKADPFAPKQAAAS